MTRIKLSYCLFLAILLIPGLFLPGLVHASNCDVSVRVIKGAVNDSEFSGKKMEVGSFIADMKHQLETLPYKEYSVIDSQNKTVAFGKESSFSLTDANKQVHNLKIEPISLEKKRVVVKVNWTDPAGDTMLATQLKVINGENLVLGTETSGDESTIVCVTLLCP